MESTNTEISKIIERKLTDKLINLTEDPAIIISKGRINIERLSTLCNFIESNSLFDSETKKLIVAGYIDRLTDCKKTNQNKLNSVISETLKELGAKLQLNALKGITPASEKEANFYSHMSNLTRNLNKFSDTSCNKEILEFTQLVILFEKELHRYELDSILLIADALANLKTQKVVNLDSDLKMLSSSAGIELGQFGEYSSYLYEKHKGTGYVETPDAGYSDVSPHLLSGMSLKTVQEYVSAQKNRVRLQDKPFTEVVGSILKKSGFKDAKITILKSGKSAFGVEWLVTWDSTAQIIQAL